MIPHHIVTGPEDAPVLVLSNSLGTTHEMWDQQAGALAERFRLVRYDTRGHGGSPVLAGPYCVDDHADDSPPCSTGSASGGATSSGCRSAA